MRGGENFGSCFSPFGVEKVSSFTPSSASISVWQDEDWIVNEFVWVATSLSTTWLIAKSVSFGAVGTKSWLLSSDVAISDRVSRKSFNINVQLYVQLNLNNCYKLKI